MDTDVCGSYTKYLDVTCKRESDSKRFSVFENVIIQDGNVDTVSTTNSISWQEYHWCVQGNVVTVDWR